MTFINIINALAPVVALMLGTGYFVKYMPWLSEKANWLIPILNSIVAFVGLFGGPAQAHAGLIDALGHVASSLAFPAKAILSMALSGGVSYFIHDKVLKGFIEQVIVPAITKKPYVAVK